MTVPETVSAPVRATEVPSSPRPDATVALTQALRTRILVLDGAMGTLIQRHELTEADYRGARFADWGQDLNTDTDSDRLSHPIAASLAVHDGHANANGPTHAQRRFDAATDPGGDKAKIRVAGGGIEAEMTTRAGRMH